MTDVTQTITVGPLTLQALPMTSNHLEAMGRIQRSINLAGSEDASFYLRQVARLGEMIDSLIPSERDRDLLDREILTGKLSTAEILRAFLARPVEDVEADRAAPPAELAKKTAAKAVKKLPAKKATRARQ